MSGFLVFRSNPKSSTVLLHLQQQSIMPIRYPLATHHLLFCRHSINHANRQHNEELWQPPS
eukprot:scaffold266_cov76-Skeletonema_menzelii.AAC.2